jgi:hypothetical protein
MSAQSKIDQVPSLNTARHRLMAAKLNEGFFMSIDVSTETIVPVNDFNLYSHGHKVSPQAVHRYVSRGVLVPGTDQRVKLESFRNGRVRYTSTEAILRFIAAQNPTQKATVTNGQRQRETAAAIHELANTL